MGLPSASRLVMALMVASLLRVVAATGAAYDARAPANLDCDSLVPGMVGAYAEVEATRAARRKVLNISDCGRTHERRCVWALAIHFVANRRISTEPRAAP